MNTSGLVNHVALILFSRVRFVAFYVVTVHAQVLMEYLKFSDQTSSWRTPDFFFHFSTKTCQLRALTNRMNETFLLSTRILFLDWCIRK